MRLVRLLCAIVLSLGISSLATAQNLGTGLYAFGSFDNRGFDSVNLGNLNTHFEIPIVTKQGRGENFDYSLVYDGLVWSPSSSTGTGYWVPNSTWGFNGELAGAYTGYLTFTEGVIACAPATGFPTPNRGTITNGFVYHDSFGRNHAFVYNERFCPGAGLTIIGNGQSTDGSGYYYDSTGTVHRRDGTAVILPSNPAIGQNTTGSITDTNGNTINNNGNGTFTDTLGVTELNITGSGSAGSPLSFTYPVTLQSDGVTSATATLSYKTYTVQTNFGCSGMTEYGATSNDLVDHLTLADNSTYSFTYEATPGGVSGAVTGRLASVTLPTGGKISYAYTGGCNGNGINADGTVGTLTRTTSDGTRSYARAPINSNATTTTLQDEIGNQALYQFTEVGDFFYETHRQIYQGTLSGTLLLDQSTCYNGVTPTCDGAAITLPITQTSALSSYNGGTQLGTKNVYDASGMLTSSTQLSGTTALESVHNSYNALEELTASTTEDGSGNAITYSYYGYDETALTATSGIPQHSAVSGTRGNQTSAHVSAGATYLNTTTTYYDTGVPLSTTTPNGTTQYSYDSTQTFATGTTLPTPSSGVSLATSATYDQQSGAIISATGMNSGQTAQVTQYNRRLKPVIVTLPNGGQIEYNYEGTTQVGVLQPMGNGSSTDTETLVDGYGRTSRVAIANGQSSNPWYQVDSCYNAVGLLQFQPVRYQGDGWGTAKQCSGNGTSYTYDALGRMTSSTNPDGTTSYQYTGRAVKKTDVNGVQRITQYDMLGRISGICEISSNASMPQSGSPVTCGMDISGTGFLTSYTYNLATDTTTITQGAQTRTFQTDAAGRTISTSEPERGTTNYSYAYNSTGLVVTRTRPKANQTSATTLTTTMTQYDSLGRVVTVTYNDGSTPTKYFYYDNNPYNSWSYVPTTNLKGNLGVTATSSSSGTLLASSLFSYDLMGHVTGMWQCAPSICGTTSQAGRHGLGFSYDLAGNLTNASDGATGAIAYGRSLAGEVTSITNQSYTDVYNTPKLVSNVVNSPNGPISYALGNGLNIYKQYDSSGRLFAQWVCTGVAASDCNTQLYGTDAYRSGVRVVAMDDTTQGASRSFGYDEFNRLTSASRISNTTQSNFSYSYDRYGNRWSQTVTQGSGLSPSVSFNSNNRITTSGYAYDAAGNLINDPLHSYQYDAEGNLISVDNGSTAQYVYDAMNSRVREQTATTTLEYLFDFAGKRISRWNVLANDAGDEGRIYWDGTPIAYRNVNGQTFFEHQDVLGTERMRTNYLGQNAEQDTSQPFGDGYSADVILSSADQDNRHFALLDYDSTSNTDHAQFRQYSPAQGRWMSPDPYDGSYDATNPQSLNRYSYVLNSPLAFTDPSGQKKPVLPNFPGGGGLPPFMDGNSFNGGFGSGWDEFATIETVSSPDGDGSYSYTPGAWSSIANSDSGNSVGSDGTIASTYDEGVGGYVTTSILGLTFSGMGGGYTGPVVAPSKDVPIGIDIFHCPSCVNTWKQSNCVVNKPFNTAADDLEWGVAGAAFVGASSNMGSGIGATIEGGIETIGKEALGVVALGGIAFHSILSTAGAVLNGCSE